MAESTQTLSISELLLRDHAIDTDTLARAQEEAQAAGVRLDKYLFDKQLVRDDDMTLALAEYLNLAPVSLANFSPDEELLRLFPKDVLTRHQVVPLCQTGKHVTVAIGDPFNLMAIDELQFVGGVEVTPVVAAERDVEAVLGRVLVSSAQSLKIEEVMSDVDGEVEVGREDDEGEESLDEMLESAEGAPVIRIVNIVLVEALRTAASDIHIEPQERSLRLRYRIDGGLVERPSPPKNLQSAIISRIKIMSDLDIAERRVPQDGRFKIRALGKEVDLRVSILPTVHGEKVVMRTLDKSSLSPNLASLGLDEFALKAMRYAIAQPHGIILVTGPTGSGKTTTLYSCLQELNSADVNIVTCEDPVEYQLGGINQVQINPDVGLTFATALRSILRQDPDIVLVGEIRDGVTADIAVKAALTGHLVLSTLHTNDAAGAITRLVDMGVEPFLLGSSLILAQAQRLYRRLCGACKREAAVSAEVLETNHIDPDFFEGAKVYEPRGCPKCNGLGFKGRGALMEVLPVDESIREGVLRGASSGELRRLAVQKGMMTLKDVGMVKVREGATSIDAALEVTGGD